MKIKQKGLIVIIMLIAALTFAACSPGGSPANNGQDVKDIVTSSERKIIYSISFSITTKSFDKSVEFIQNSLVEDEWFDEVQYYDDSAYFVARVKSSRLDQYLEHVSGNFGEKNLENFRKTATDISLDYFDVQGRLDSLESERARLDTLMADDRTTISDIILINQRLAEIDFELQKLNGQLNRFDSSLDYSIVTIHISKPSYTLVIFLSIVGVLAAAGISAFVLLKVRESKRKRDSLTNQM